MVDKYYTGGGTPQENSSPKLFLAAFLGGFPEGTDFIDLNDPSGHITNDDPYFKFGGTGGAKEVEIGLYNNRRIKFETTEITIPSYDPTGKNDYSIATKKYVDDNAGGSGETNTMSSEGSGVSVYWQKDDVNFELNAIKSENNRISVSLDGVSHDIEFTLNEGNIVHDNLSGYAADRHIAHSGVTITAGTGLSGGGTIAANRTINCTITQYTDALVEAVITAELVGGQSIDNRIDALLTANADGYVTQAETDALYSVLAHIHDDRYYTETEIDANTYTRAQVDALTWNEADILDLDKYTVAEVDAIEDRFDEQGEAFPGPGSEGDLFYSRADDSWYRWNAEAVAWIEVGVMGAIASSTDNLGNHTATTTLNMAGNKIDNVGHIQSDGYIYFAPANDTDDELIFRTYSNEIKIWQEGATDSTEIGALGHSGTATTPFQRIYGRLIYDDDGTLGSYSEVDDLQLIRDLKEYKREKALSPEYPDVKRKVWDMNTLPWIKAHNKVNKLANDDNKKRYALPIGARDGFLLSALKKLLEKIDIMELKIKELEGK